MADFAVWAPRASSSVEVQTRGQRHAMRAGAGGWYRATVPEAGPGDDYTFIIDGGRPLPDPRSPWQPAGPMGPSRLLDHAEFQWTDASWQPAPLSSAVIYELHIGTFTPQGTFDSTIQRLDHLVEVGITHLELMPVCETPGTRNWGYDGVDLFAPHHALGGPAGLKRLIDACHSRGLAVLVDVVYNHLGPSGNFLPQFGPYFMENVPTLWGQAVNLAGPHSDEVRQFCIDNALMWLRDYHADGLRLDAVHAFYDPGAVHILEDMALQVQKLQSYLGRHLVLIAESDLNDPRIVRSIDAGGYGMDAQWSDDFHHALHAWLTGESSGYYSGFGGVQPMARAMAHAYVYAGSYCPYRFRKHGRPPTGLSGHRFLAYSQNHDQVGNRCRGERLCHLVSPQRSKIAAALVMASPFVPMIFMGQEWAASSPFQYFTSHDDPEIAEATRQGRSQEFVGFGWQADDVPDPQDEATFLRSKLHWNELSQPQHAEMLHWYRRLIALRKRIVCLSDGRMDAVEVSFNCDEDWLVMHRGEITVAANLGATPRKLDVRQDKKNLPHSQECPAESGAKRVRDQSASQSPPRVVLVGSSSQIQFAASEQEVILPPNSVVIIGPQRFAAAH